MRDLTIVMYHFVRDLARSPYPRIRARTTEEFEGQIDHLRRHYSIITGEDLMSAVVEGAPLPPDPMLLTFDDGYADHYTDVLPVLTRYGLSGCFFPVARCIREHVVLDVNKIHFILAAEPDSAKIVDRIVRCIHDRRNEFDLRSVESYRKGIRRKNRYDSEEVFFIKSTLQHDLPAALRRTLIDDLFSELVTDDEAAFARELYLTPEWISEMLDRGMYFGSHGFEHVWLDSLGPEEQVHEIDRSLDFLEGLGIRTDRWMICYPFGGYDASLRRAILERGCVAGLTTRPHVADLTRDDPLELPRLDTNDFPVRPSSVSPSSKDPARA